jgi:dihydrofolate reductase
MGTVRLHMSMSLDGFIAGPNVDVEHPMGEGGDRLHDWIFAGNPDRTGHSPLTSTRDPRDAQVMDEMFENVGAVVMGRTTFDVGKGPWGDDPPFGMPCFVLTHTPADTVVKGATTFTFVTDGIDSALKQAGADAGGKGINLMGATTAQQFLRAGLLDEIQINLVPVLLGGGTRLFEHLGADHIELQRTRVIESPTVTHVKFRVVN